MIRTSETTTGVCKALADFQAQALHVPKNATNPFFDSRYADLFSIKTICDPVLRDNDLALTQFPGGGESGNPTLITRLIHVETGEFMEAEAHLPLSKDDPQGLGSAITYMRRYSYCAILGIVADPDDDGNAASYPRDAVTNRPVQNQPERYEEVNGDQIPIVGGDPITRTGPHGQLISEAQGRRVYAMCKSAYGGDCDVSASVSAMLGRPIKRTEEITKAEIEGVFARLKTDGA